MWAGENKEPQGAQVEIPVGFFLFTAINKNQYKMWPRVDKRKDIMATFYIDFCYGQKKSRQVDTASKTSPSP